ncbi:hypothetical protein AGMMS49975_14080 [Clostridia bacterium]|nr:hypothetical protein AGMMS49975_14080 [Clostridia bacterium]
MGQKFKNLADLGRVKGFSGAEGKVRFDFTDALTGKVKNRVEGGNMVFSEQLRSANIISFLSQLVTPIVYLTDGEDEPTDDFQLLPGSIVGWGSPMNGSIAGAYQGAFNAPASKIGVIPPTKDRCVYKYVYDFLPTQLPFAPKAVGITQQFMSLYNYNTPNYFEANAAYTNNALNYIYDAQSGLGYAISNAGVVTVYNPLDGTSSTIDVSAVVGAVSALSVGINQQNGKGYILAYSATAAYRYMYEFSDLTFSELAETYNFAALTNYPATSKVFAVYDNFYYYWNGGWYRGDFTNNINAVLQTAPTDYYFTSIGNGGQLGSLIVIGDDVFVYYDYYMTNAFSNQPRVTVWDIKNNVFKASLSSVNKGNSTSYCQQIIYGLTNRKSPLISSQQYGKYYSKNALTHFKIPENGYEREDGQGVSLTYTLELFF